MHYSNEAESRLAWESLKVFRNFDAMVGGDCGFEAPGFVQIVDPAHADALRANVAMQQRLGIDTRLVSREELTEISPDLRVDDVGAAAYEPGSGFADPNATTFAFAAAARRLGASRRGAAWPAWRRPEDGWPLPWWWPSPARGPASFSIRSASTSGSRPTGSRCRYFAGRKASRAVTPR
jgi:glycine/D-amino acid oxidase-like deaminating enzyme